MNLLYLDSSAWVKRYQAEAGSDWMARLWGPHVNFCCATLGLVEVICTVCRRHAGKIDPAVTGAVLNLVRSDFSTFSQIDLDASVIAVADTIAQRRHLRAADAVHLASAIHVRDTAKASVTFVTSDAELFASAVAEGLAALDPAQNPPLP